MQFCILDLHPAKLLAKSFKHYVLDENGVPKNNHPKSLQYGIDFKNTFWATASHIQSQHT